MTISLDLNADVGERPAALADGSEEQLIALVSSVNVACGGHAGDDASMRAVMTLAMRHGVAIGAHPSYPDRDQFGRRHIDIDFDELAVSVHGQVAALMVIADDLGATVRHIKPHGALYNAAARSRSLADLIGQALLPWRESVRLVGLAGSLMLEAWTSQGFQVSAEAFADRRYEPDGGLRSREHDDALIHDAQEAARQAVQIAASGSILAIDGSRIICRADTIGLHSDAPGALQRVMAVRRAIEQAGIRVGPPALTGSGRPSPS